MAANLYALILAGGASSRFWPLSGDEHPKYLLRVADHSLIELAWQRAAACTDPANILVVTGGAQAHLIREALPALPAANLCVEPARRDTAAAIALGCKRIAAAASDANVLVLPADTLLDPPDALADGVRAALAAPGHGDAIHVFGVEPARPEGGFGYIEPGEPLAPGVLGVRSFKEKPGREEAMRLQARGFLWNVGCFLFSLKAFDAEFRRHMPGHSSRLKPASPGNVTEADYDDLESVSIDFGLIEKASNLRLIKLDAAFDDIGTWDALLERLPEGDAQAVSVGGDNNRAIGGASVAVVGASDLLVVVNEGRVLVLKQGHGQHVRKVPGLIRE